MSDAPSLRSGRPGVRRVAPAQVEALVEEAEALGFLHRRVELAGCTDKAELLARLATALDFPAWFGANWDALIDCLSDLAWLGPAPGYALVLDDAQDLRRGAPADYDQLVEILDVVADRWRAARVPFWVFLNER